MVFEISHDCWTLECPDSSCSNLNNQSSQNEFLIARDKCELSHFIEKYDIYYGLFST